ncbi:PREDICTED: putative multidrug resistance protein [Lupinus angustifolius]|uniref:putative multidrug resistance protein n=1 Tax=Lupinus angustifolius TaxID=3871 RepID=UPI00092E48B5|nr:PREDICTED: putative multidrug resistance protein [Lupinus angustifolius]
MGNNSMFRYADGIDKLLMLFGTLGSLGDGLQNPLMMYILSDVINAYGDKNSILTMHDVNKYALRLLLVAIGVGISAFIEGVCWKRTAERQAWRMRMEYMKSVLRQEVGFFDTKNVGSSTTYQVVSLISSDSNTIQVALSEKIPCCMAYMSTFLFCHIFAFLLSWRLTLASIPLSIMFILPALLFRKSMLDLAMKMIESYGVAGGIAEQAISSIRTVYSYVGENQTLDRFSSALQKNMKFGIKQGFAKGLMLGSFGVIYISWGFQAWVGTMLITDKGEKGGHVFVAGFNVLMGGLSILSALPNLSAITEANVAVTHLYEMIDRVPTIDSENKIGKALSYVRGGIEFQDIYFCYPSRPEVPVLQGLNLTIPAGKRVGLVGGSGSGKSTVVALLQRFYDPVEGEILLDGHKISRLQLKWWRSQLGLVNQEPVLFATSIKENILFGKEGASMDSVISAAKSANAHDFIVNLPDGYETQVGKFGMSLSGGQKQRIAIARALLRDPKVLLLDEATSALDAQSERVVQAAIDQASRGRTTIIIAHRLSTIRIADIITVLQAGRVIESGSHNELMEMNGGQGGEYAKMVELQQVTTQNDESKTSDTQVEGRRSSHNHSHRMSGIPLSPGVSFKSSTQGTPMLSPFSQGLSMGTPYSYSIQYDYDDDCFEDNLKITNYPTPSHWHLLKMNAPEWGSAVFGVLAAIGSGAVQPIHAYYVGVLISFYFEPENSKMKSKTRTLALTFLGIGVFNFFASILQHYNFAIMGERLTKRIREKILGKLMTFEVGWFDSVDNTSAAISERLSSDANLVRSLVGDRMSLLAQAVSGSVFAYTLGLFLTWRLSLVMIAVQPIVIGSFYSRSILMKSMAEKSRKAQREGSQLASEAVINHRTITAFSSQKRMLALFKSTSVGPKKESIRQSWISGLGLFGSQFFNTASTALAYWYGGRLLVDNLIEPKHLFQAFLILLFTAYTIAEAGTMASDISKGKSAVGSVFSILERNTEIDPDTSWGANKKRKIRGSVELISVFFAYPTRPDHMILKGMYLKVEAGRQVALVGHSGSGKSTIIGLIERFYDPLKGTVCIDEQDVKSYNLRMLRSHIALLSQEPILFAGTIRENIAYGKANATESEIRKAAAMANAHEFISGMKDGYETYYGERGVHLSRGQKQRIALARAIIKNPTILLLDEATSALDNVSDKLVQEALEKMMVGRTCIIVAHKLCTIQQSNNIVVIKNGKVVEQGSHNELISLGHEGAYCTLVKLQGGNSPR